MTTSPQLLVWAEMPRGNVEPVLDGRLPDGVDRLVVTADLPSDHRGTAFVLESAASSGFSAQVQLVETTDRRLTWIVELAGAPGEVALFLLAGGHTIAWTVAGHVDEEHEAISDVGPLMVRVRGVGGRLLESPEDAASVRAVTVEVPIGKRDDDLHVRLIEPSGRRRRPQARLQPDARGGGLLVATLRGRDFAPGRWQVRLERRRLSLALAYLDLDPPTPALAAVRLVHIDHDGEITPFEGRLPSWVRLGRLVAVVSLTTDPAPGLRATATLEVRGDDGTPLATVSVPITPAGPSSPRRLYLSVSLDGLFLGDRARLRLALRLGASLAWTHDLPVGDPPRVHLQSDGALVGEVDLDVSPEEREGLLAFFGAPRRGRSVRAPADMR